MSPEEKPAGGYNIYTSHCSDTFTKVLVKAVIWERLELLSVASCRNVYSHIIDCKLVDCKKLNDFQTVCLLIFVFLFFV